MPLLISITLSKVCGSRVKHFKADYCSDKKMFLGFILIRSELKYCDFLLVFQGRQLCDLYVSFSVASTSHRHLIIVIFLS